MTTLNSVKKTNGECRMKNLNTFLSYEQHEGLINILRKRFEDNMARHKDIDWGKVLQKLQLESSSTKRWSLYQMEISGGEPDIVAYDENTDEYIFYDCSPESPKSRRSLCYDKSALESRKEHKPNNTVIDMANEMGIKILNEQEYRALQELGNFDLKTSSWILTPTKIRQLGGALFCDRRYDHVFVYHNGAESYYGSRGFRALLKI
jgi:hypothetical protein